MPSSPYGEEYEFCIVLSYTIPLLHMNGIKWDWTKIFKSNQKMYTILISSSIYKPNYGGWIIINNLKIQCAQTHTHTQRKKQNKTNSQNFWKEIYILIFCMTILFPTKIKFSPPIKCHTRRVLKLEKSYHIHNNCN